MSIKDNLQAIQSQLSGATLIAVSKNFGQDAVLEAINAGQTIFGENRVQEAQEKFSDFKEKYALQLHLIGPLQTNKLRDAVQLFDVIHTLDREKLAEKMAEELQKTKKQMQLFIQVNTGEEDQKAGIAPKDTDRFIEQCLQVYKLPVTGLMCIPPLNEEPALHFALLADIAKRHKLKNLSMGMSADFETAIRFGATHVRIGFAIFGARDLS